MMCRLLSCVCVADSPLAADVLPAFTAMSTEHCDGWGLAWHTPDGLRTEREPVRAGDSRRYRDLLDTTRTDAALLHLRLATPGLPVTHPNTHPFLRDGLAFMHNGVVGPTAHIDALLDDDLPPVGDTDSERYFLAMLGLVRAGAAPAAALLQTAHRMLALSATSSANAMLLTDDALHVVCAYRPDRLPSNQGQDYFDLHYRVRPDAVVVASSGVPQSGWTRLSNGSVLSVARTSLDCTVTAGLTVIPMTAAAVPDSS
jgi:predicted glutamine amidotransferase